jgi:hypothetical protein
MNNGNTFFQEDIYSCYQPFLRVLGKGEKAGNILSPIPKAAGYYGIAPLATIAVPSSLRTSP